MRGRLPDERHLSRVVMVIAMPTGVALLLVGVAIDVHKRRRLTIWVFLYVAMGLGLFVFNLWQLRKEKRDGHD
jgi:hypothetical protein